SKYSVRSNGSSPSASLGTAPAPAPKFSIVCPTGSGERSRGSVRRPGGERGRGGGRGRLAPRPGWPARPLIGKRHTTLAGSQPVRFNHDGGSGSGGRPHVTGTPMPYFCRTLEERRKRSLVTS